MRLLWTITLLSGLALPALAEEKEAGTSEAADTVIETAVPAVTVGTAQLSEVQERVPVVGTLIARQEVQVNAQVSGYEITEIMAEAGDQVLKGQVLARLSSDTLAALLAQTEAEYQRAEAGVRQAESNIDSAEASLTQAVTALERVQRLRQTGNASQSTLDDAVAAEASARAAAASAADGLAVAKASLAQAAAARQIARLNFNRAEITAPVDGRVVERSAMLGALAGGGALFTIVADGEIEMSADVIETALQRLKVGAPVEVDVAGVGQVAGKVRLIPASVDPVTRLGKMRISLDEVPGLRTGLFASGWVITARREAITILATAVLSDDQGDRVQIVKDGIVHTRPVKAGLLWQDMREIIEGVAEGEQVIARSGAFFRDGDKVKAVGPATTDAGTEMAAGEGKKQP